MSSTNSTDAARLRLLVDGYNVVAPVAPPGRSADPRWLERERMRLLDRLADHLDEATRRRTAVVFDAAAPPADQPSRWRYRTIDVRFAVDEPEADDLLEALIASHTAPKRLTVISSDHRIQSAAKRRGATPFDSEPWLDALLDGRVRLAGQTRRGVGEGSRKAAKPSEPVRPGEVTQWMQEFGFADAKENRSKRRPGGDRGKG